MKIRYKDTEGELLALYEEGGLWCLNIETNEKTVLGYATASWRDIDVSEIIYLN